MNPSNPTALEELSAQQVADLLNARQILLVDVREPDEYAAQRISGALLFPLSTLDALALPPEAPRRVVFHCGSGKRSALAAQACLAAGFPRAAHMTGGIGAWKSAGLPILQLDPARDGSRVRSSPFVAASTTDAHSGMRDEYRHCRSHRLEEEIPCPSIDSCSPLRAP
jgi:rhodanese-related sulfurtransferase